MQTITVQFEARKVGSIIRETYSQDFESINEARLAAALFTLAYTHPSYKSCWAYIWQGSQAMRAIEVMHASDDLVMAWEVPESFYDPAPPTRTHQPRRTRWVHHG
jgi:hypothetical protein